MNVLHLIPSSKEYIELICDYCFTPYKKQYTDYLKRKEKSPIKKDCCKKCIGEKIKESNQLVYGVNSTMQVDQHNKNFKKSFKEKYGVENPSQLDNVKEKVKETNLKKYGVPYYSQTNEYKKKVKQTSLERYGVEHHLQSDVIISKRIATNLSKYGVEYVSQSKHFKNKYKQTYIDKYGIDHYSKTNEFLIKYEATNLEKYGVKNYAQTDECKEKRIKTNNKKYGKDHYTQTDEFKERFKQLCQEKYGCNNPMQNEIIKRKAVNTLYKNGTCPTSSQQLTIYNMLKEKGYNVELNYPVSNVNLDVAIFIGDIKIDLEYDCWYWHKDKLNYDHKRDEFLKSQGWKIFRIKSKNKIPTLQEIERKIEQLVSENDKKFTSIILEDWDERIL